MSNPESISAKLRRWADESKNNAWCGYPTGNACVELKISKGETRLEERELFRFIADEIDREMDELRELVNPGGQPIGEAVREIATGEDKYPWGDSKYPLLKKALDRYYLPRPLFEDGEPVQFGDTFVRDYGKDGTVSSLTYTKGNSDYVNINGYERHDFDHRLKRPKPQVLDADGVPIEVGDAVWILKDSEHAKWTVIEPYNRYDGIQTVYVESRGIKGHACPENITHREPDSQERIDEDAQKDAFDYWRCNGVRCRECPSMIDGEKPRHRYGVDWCSDAKTLDLLHRQRELDGRDA